jgi:hypothetical protein
MNLTRQAQDVATQYVDALNEYLAVPDLSRLCIAYSNVAYLTFEKLLLTTAWRQNSYQIWYDLADSPLKKAHQDDIMRLVSSVISLPGKIAHAFGRCSVNRQCHRAQCYYPWPAHTCTCDDPVYPI